MKKTNLRRLIGTTIASLGLLGVLAVSPQKVKAEGRPKINSAANINSVKAVGYSPESTRTDYIGLTVDTDDNGSFDINDKDYFPRSVNGEFNETFSIMADRDEVAGKRYIVSLWNRKVDDCGCNWCDKNGYHLENRLARDTGKIPKKAKFEW